MQRTRELLARQRSELETEFETELARRKTVMEGETVEAIARVQEEVERRLLEKMAVVRTETDVEAKRAWAEREGRLKDTLKQDLAAQLVVVEVVELFAGFHSIIMA